METDDHRFDAKAYLGVLQNGALFGVRFGLDGGETLMLTIPAEDTPTVLDKIATDIGGKARADGAVVRTVNHWLAGHTGSGYVILKIDADIPLAIEASAIPKLIEDLQRQREKILAGAS